MTGHQTRVRPPGHGHAQVDPGPALAMLVLGAPLLVVAGFLASDEIGIMRGSVTVQGRVVRISTVVGHSRAGARMPSRDLHAPVLAFRAPDGRQVEVLSRDYANPPCCQVGESVTVRFPTGAPERAKVVRLRDAWLWPGVLGLGGFVLMVSGLITWRIAWRRSRTATPAPPGNGPVRRG